MNPKKILEELVGILEANGVQVRDERLSGQCTGLCRGAPSYFWALVTASTRTM